MATSLANSVLRPNNAGVDVYEAMQREGGGFRSARGRAIRDGIGGTRKCRGYTGSNLASSPQQCKGGSIRGCAKGGGGPRSAREGRYVAVSGARASAGGIHKMRRSACSCLTKGA